MRRRSNLFGLGAFLLLCSCSGDSFTSSGPRQPDASAGTGGAKSGTGGANPGSGGATSGGSTATGGVTTSAGGGPVANGGAVGVEAGVAGAVGVEAGVAEASGPRTWCSGQQVLFCEDFDRYADLNELLNAPGYSYSLIGGQFSFASDGSVPSKPNALRVVSTATKDVKTLLARTLPPFASPPSRIRVEFTLRIDKAENIGALAGAAFAAVLNGQEVSDGAVALAVGASIFGATQLEVGYVEPTTDAGTGFNAEGATGPFPPLNQWIGRYAIDIQYSGAAGVRTGCAHLLAGGADQLAKCLALPASLSAPKQITVVLGLYSAGLWSNSGNVEVEFDNLVVTAS